MHVAIPVWNGRVSPVFESVRTLVVLEVEDGRQKGRTEVHLTDPAPHVRVRRLVDRDVDVLVCGAISGPVAEMCAEAGITVIPWVSGNFEHVVEAFLAGSLPNPDLTMPGCCCRRLSARRRNRGPGSGGGNGRRRGRRAGRRERGSGRDSRGGEGPGE